MSSEKMHEQREELSGAVVDAHRAYQSLIEELDAVDWYNQRADATANETLKEILIHNRDEEMEHACMLLEWLRRNQDGWDEKLKTYLFEKADITTLEEEEAEEQETGETIHPDLGIGKPEK